MGEEIRLGVQDVLTIGKPMSVAPPVLTRLRDWTLAARGRRRSMLALGAGAASVLAMAPFFLSPVLLITLPVIVWLLDGVATGPASVLQETARHGGIEDGRAAAEGSALLHRPQSTGSAFSIGWWFGFGYFFLGLFWVGEAFLVEPEVFGWLLPFAVTSMPAGLALFFGAATAVAARAWSPGLARILVLAVALSAAEWLRGHILTGFPWNVLGYALTSPLPLMQASGLVGIYGLTLLTVVCLASPLVLAADMPDDGPRWRRWAPGLALAAVPLAGLVLYGSIRLSAPVADVPGVKLRIVQPSVPQRDKWRREKQRQIFDDHLALSLTDRRGTGSGLGAITHVVWPEAAMPFLPLNSPEALAEIGRMLGDRAYLLTGALRAEDAQEQRNSDVPEQATANRRVYNSLIVLGPGGTLTTVYDKIHLVPFGEYLPLQSVLEAIGLRQLTRLRGGFSSGHNPRPLLAVPGLPPLLGLVCYEAIFPAAVVQGRERPGLLVNVTNDGWFGNTTGPRQHLHQARVRAAEEGLPMVRAANNGISAMIDPFGRVLHSLGLDVRGSFDTLLPAVAAPTLYSRIGDGTWLMMVAVCLIIVGLARRIRSVNSSTQ